MKLNELTITDAQKGLRAKEFSALEIVKACLARAKELNPKLNAYIELWDDGALQKAKEIDAVIAAGDDPGPLAGIPFALKDNLLVAGKEINSASKILAGHISAYTATAVDRLLSSGAILLGRTNMDEFAMGSSGESSAYGPTKNPWDAERVPGGSSSGSAAAVSADICLAALGSDTGGSIRQPASLCGVVGLKPTYGRVSRYGLMAMASSLDQIGPIAKTVKDAAAILQAIENDDPKDATSVVLEETVVPDLLQEDIKGMKIGIPKEYHSAGMDPGVLRAAESAVKKLEELGAKITEISLPHMEYALAVYYLIMSSEVSANLARYDGVRFGKRAARAKSMLELYTESRGRGFGAEVRRRIMLGTYALSSGYYDAYYKKAQEVRSLITRDFREAFKDADVIVLPTSPTPAFKIGEKTADPLTMYLADIFTVSMNLAGIPAISVPCGFSEEHGKKLPVGIQFIGRHFGEAQILRAARAYEAARGPLPKPSL